MTHIKSTRRRFLRTSLGIAAAGATSRFWSGWCAGGEANGDPLPWVPGSWTLAVLPDTQRYTIDPWKGIFSTITQWLARNRQARNIGFVLHEGDITGGNTADTWQVASEAMAVLDKAGIPYSLTTGNHDHDAWNPFRNTPDRNTLLGDYFPIARFQSMPTFGGVFEPGRTENNYHRFTVAGKHYLTLALECGPRNETVAWANRVLAEHSDRVAVVVTHAYLYSDGTRYDWAAKGASQDCNPHCDSYGFSTPHDGSENVNDGQQLWQKLVNKNKNVRLVLSGHVPWAGARLSGKGEHGQTVHELVAAYHDPPEGYLRLLEFLPDGKTIQVKTYSPHLDKHLTDSNQQFVLSIE
ncbi:MAG: metallophosphoesterase [Planctomycetia bacterium]|nr:metallophosphoesterase [Planctomycetia bacterium]